MYAFGGCRFEKRIVRCEKASQEISKGPRRRREIFMIFLIRKIRESFYNEERRKIIRLESDIVFFEIGRDSIVDLMSGAHVHDSDRALNRKRVGRTVSD